MDEMRIVSKFTRGIISKAIKHLKEYWFELTERGEYNASFLLLRKIYKAYYERQ